MKKVNRIVKLKKNEWKKISLSPLNFSILFDDFKNTKYEIKCNDNEFTAKKELVKISSKRRAEIFIKSDRESKATIIFYKKGFLNA